MYFESKFDKVFTTLLSLQQVRGATLRLTDETNPFWKIEKNKAGTNGEEVITVQPLIMFNTLQSSNINDIVIQDNDIQIDKSEQKQLIIDEATCDTQKKVVEAITPHRIDQEIICQNKKDTTIVATYNPYKRTRDESYIYGTGQLMRGDTVHAALETDYIGGGSQ